MKILFFLLAFLMLNTGRSKAQQLQDGGEADKECFRVIREAVQYLLSKPQPGQPKKNMQVVPSSWNVYDTLIQVYYDTNYRRDSTEGYDTGFLQPSFQKLLLYNIDLYLDILPLDSIMVTPERGNGFKQGSPASRLKVYSIGYMINGRIAIATILFFTQSNKLLSIEPFIDFNHLNEGIDKEGFYRRHKWDKIKDLLYRF